MSSLKKLIVMSVVFFFSFVCVKAQDTTFLTLAAQDTSHAPPDFLNVDTPPQIISQTIPEYPEAAKKEGINGSVYLKMWVGKDGLVKKVVLLKSSNKIFDQPSIDAAMKYRFSPAILRDKPVDVWVVIPFTFKLKPDKPDATVKGASVKMKQSGGESEGKEYQKLSKNFQSYQDMVKKYDAAMYFQRMKDYKKALKSYREFLEQAKGFPYAPEEMVRYAKMMVKRYSAPEVDSK
jgi:TonB family protein